MADVRQAVTFVLRLEDSTLAGTITTAADGKRTRFGIDEHFHPDLTNCLFFTSMGSVAALKIAESIYDKSYAEPLCIAEIADQNIANYLLALGVNCGTATAAKMLQGVLGVNGDGRIGPLTLMKLESSDAPEVLLGLRDAAIAHYEELVRKNPALSKYLAGWINRANA